MTTPARSTDQLNRIAAALNVPVEAFTDPAARPAAGPAPGALVAALLFDPDGRRFAAAFPYLSAQARKAFADSVEAYVRSLSAAPAQSADGRP